MYCLGSWFIFGPCLSSWVVDFHTVLGLSLPLEKPWCFLEIYLLLSLSLFCLFFSLFLILPFSTPPTKCVFTSKNKQKKKWKRKSYVYSLKPIWDFLIHQLIEPMPLKINQVKETQITNIRVYWSSYYGTAGLKGLIITIPCMHINLINKMKQTSYLYEANT